jgi:hypothetical protein
MLSGFAGWLAAKYLYSNHCKAKGWKLSAVFQKMLTKIVNNRELPQRHAWDSI